MPCFKTALPYVALLIGSRIFLTLPIVSQIFNGLDPWDKSLPTKAAQARQILKTLLNDQGPS
ncbi:MAG: hypothetical protein ACOWWO_17070 [Peptococcaceae bacterium]